MKKWFNRIFWMMMGIFVYILLAFGLVTWYNMAEGALYKGDPEPAPIEWHTPTYLDKPKGALTLEDALKDYVFSRSKIDKKMASRIVEGVLAESDNPLVLLAIFRKESNFDPYTTSHAGAQGLGQIMWKYHKGRCKSVGASSKRDLFDPEINIKATEAVYEHYSDLTGGDMVATLTKYYGSKDPKYYTPIMNEYFKLKHLAKKVKEINERPVHAYDYH